MCAGHPVRAAAIIIAALAPCAALQLSGARGPGPMAFSGTSVSRMAQGRALTGTRSNACSPALGPGLRSPALGPRLRARGARTATALLPAVTSAVTASPLMMFQTLFFSLAATAAVVKVLDRDKSAGIDEEKMPAEMRSLQMRFLIVFWLLRMADWLQGPYFYEVYASKVIGGTPVSLDMVSKLFLIGFGTTGLLGPLVGKLVDSRGRRAGTLALVLLYTILALSITYKKTNQLS